MKIIVILFLIQIIMGTFSLEVTDSRLDIKGTFNHSRAVQCRYGADYYECGAKTPSGQYCNFASCTPSSGTSCCQVALCSNYFSCVCGNGLTIDNCRN